MTVERFQEIQKRLDELKEKETKAGALMENIEKEWKENYGVSDPEEIQAIIDREKEKKVKLDKKLAALEEELEELTDWDNI